MILLKTTRSWQRSFILSVFVLLACFLAGTRVNAQGDDLNNAAMNGDLPRVKTLLAKGADINAKDSNGATALIVASLYGNLEVVRELLSKGADINAKDHDGMTALMLASITGHVDVVQVLLAKGADVETKENDGATALILASENGFTEVVKALLAKGADVNARLTTKMVATGGPPIGNLVPMRVTKDGRTALMLASGSGYLEVVKALLAKGANVNAKAYDGTTALDAATAGGHADVRALLLKAGAKQ